MNKKYIAPACVEIKLQLESHILDISMGNGKSAVNTDTEVDGNEAMSNKKESNPIWGNMRD